MGADSLRVYSLSLRSASSVFFPKGDSSMMNAEKDGYLEPISSLYVIVSAVCGRHWTGLAG